MRVWVSAETCLTTRWDQGSAAGTAAPQNAEAVLEGPPREPAGRRPARAYGVSSSLRQTLFPRIPRKFVDSVEIYDRLRVIALSLLLV
jgi:hypothetical protein